MYSGAARSPEVSNNCTTSNSAATPRRGSFRVERQRGSGCQAANVDARTNEGKESDVMRVGLERRTRRRSRGAFRASGRRRSGAIARAADRGGPDDGRQPLPPAPAPARGRTAPCSPARAGAPSRRVDWLTDRRVAVWVNSPSMGDPDPGAAAARTGLERQARRPTFPVGLHARRSARDATTRTAGPPTPTPSPSSPTRTSTSCCRSAASPASTPTGSTRTTARTTSGRRS